MELITYQHPELLPIEVIGGKAHGLFRLKALERRLTEAISSPSYVTEAVVPPFFVVPVGYTLDGRITEVAQKISKGNFAVRSSSPYEDGTDYSFDGRFETRLNGLNLLMEESKLDLKTGDMVRIRSDGITAQFYKEVN